MTIDWSIITNSISDLIETFFQRLPMVVLGLILFAVLSLAAKWIGRFIDRLVTRAGASPSAGVALGRLGRWSSVFLGLLIALSVAVESFDVGGLIQILGITSVAVGFAFRDILQNFLAGILILLTEPFKVNDQIIVEDYEGTIERIDIRASLIETYDSRRVVIPNATLFTESVLVNTAFEKRRSDYDIGIGYGDDVDQACRLIVEAIETVPGVCQEPAPSVRIWDLAPAAINIRARWWTDSRRSDVVLVKSRVIVAIVEKLGEHGIDMPFPTQLVLFHDQTEAVDGDRLLQREGWPPTGDGEAPRPLTIAGSLQRLADAIAERPGNGPRTHSG